MPRELLAIAPKVPTLKEYEERSLAPGELRIRSRLSTEKHGTTLTLYRGQSPFSDKLYDPQMSIFIKQVEGQIQWGAFPFPLGNMTVGTVEEVTPQVTKLKPGDSVYGYLPIRETHTASQDGVMPVPQGLTDEEVLCIDPAVVALMAVREGRLRLGDRVAIFGAGAIGLFAGQMAKLSGCTLVIAIEPMPKRRELALRFGVDQVLDPTGVDVGLKVRNLTGGTGVDTSLEMSGNYRVLHEAIRSTRFGGSIVPVSWYHGEAHGLNLGEEFHFNRQVLISGARVESEPYRDFPLWDRRRIYDTVIELFQRRMLSAQGILDPIVRFNDVVEAYKLIDERPSECVKLGVSYSD